MHFAQQRGGYGRNDHESLRHGYRRSSRSICGDFRRGSSSQPRQSPAVKALWACPALVGRRQRARRRRTQARAQRLGEGFLAANRLA